MSFSIPSKTIVGLLGESGSGKTSTALPLLGLHPAKAHIVSGKALYYGHDRLNVDLLTLKDKEMREIRGAEISIIHQDLGLLNPVMRAGDQVMEVLRAHKTLTSSQMREQVCELFLAMGLTAADRIFSAYPHQLSGGQRRRIAIAQALICRPQLVIADEPTSWLDENTRSELLDLMLRQRDLHGTSFLLISHEPDVLAAAADEIVVMYAGEIVESGPMRDVLEHPLHPYTQALLRCGGYASDSGQSAPRQKRLPCIPGNTPDPTKLGPGCAFAERCGERMSECEFQKPELVTISASHSAPVGQSVRCFKYYES